MSENESKKQVHLHLSKPKSDKRVTRTRDRLGDALIELMQEKPFDSITVQEVLDRAKVGRSTFYVHYRDKDDLFLSDAEEFLEAVSGALSHHKDKSNRVLPVKEFFAHVREAEKLRNALVESGRIHDFMQLAQGHFSRGIEKRLAEIPAAKHLDASQRVMLSQSFAGSALSLMNWWLDHRAKESPEQMDELFHRMVWGAVRAGGDPVDSSH
jgi:AcrR family transcriptional regulator